VAETTRTTSTGAVDGLVEAVLSGSRRALARAITAVETSGSEAREIMARLYSHTGQAHVVGVTGSPGIGKSTLVGELARVFRQKNVTVGIVAVDPTSPFSGGAILGDRIRMRELAGDPGVFMRSMATRGYLGGLAAATSDIVRVLDAAGYELVLIETVGVGQAEVDVARMAQTTIVVEAPGLGDDVQTLKAGIMEIADIFVVNKADLAGSDAVVNALRAALALGGGRSDYVGHHFLQMWADAPAGAPHLAQPSTESDGTWQPPVIEASAVNRLGILDVAAAVEEHRAHLHRSGAWVQREKQRVQMDLEYWLKQLMLERLFQQVNRAELSNWVDDIVDRRAAPQDVAGRLLERYRKVT
jgi:LAO/AO transport system kinase